MCRRRLASRRWRPPLADLKLHSSGKVREIYEDGDDLLMVASDRISVYDVILPTADPRQGQGPDPDVALLVRADRATSAPTTSSPRTSRAEAAGRGDAGAASSRCTRSSASSAATSRARAGRSTSETGEVCGIELPEGLRESDKLPEPIFTPATKAELGDHDENVDFDRAAEIVGDRALMEELRRVSIEIYERGAEHAAERGIILADTKFEFGATPAPRSSSATRC